MRTYSFVTVDVFTDRRFGGNQLAVLPEASGLDYWAGGSHAVFVAEDGPRILGTYFLCPNQRGGGACRSAEMPCVARSSRSTKTDSNIDVRKPVGANADWKMRPSCPNTKRYSDRWGDTEACL